MSFTPHMRRSGWTSWSILMTVLVLLLAACGTAGDQTGSPAPGEDDSDESESPTEEIGQVTVGIGITAGTFGPWIVAVEEGFAAAHGVDMQIRIFEQGGLAMEAMLGGEVDISAPSKATVVPAGAGGAGVVLGIIGTSSDIFGAVSADGINSAEDLTDSAVTVGRPEGSSPYFLGQYLEFHGIDETDINVTAVDAASLVPAISRGDIQAFFAFEPHVSTALDEVSGVQLLARGGDDDVFLDKTTVIVTEELAANEPLAAAVMAAMVDATEWMQTNREAAAEHIAEYFDAPAEQHLEDMSIYEYTVFMDDETIEDLQSIADWMLEEGAIERLPDWDRFINVEPLRTAAPDRVDVEAPQ